MVAVAGIPPAMETLGPEIVLAGGDGASGLAQITAQYLTQVLADSPDKREEAARLRGRLGLHAREGGVEITLVFEEGAITVEEGLEQPDAVISGQVETLLSVLGGRENPALALGRRSMSLRVSGRRPLFGYQAYHLMRLPDVHVWSGVPPRVVVIAGLVAGAVLLLLWSRRRVRPGDGQA